MPRLDGLPVIAGMRRAKRLGLDVFLRDALDVGRRDLDVL